LPSTRIGRRVKALRERQEMSQVRLAKLAKVTQPYLAQLEAGVRKNPSLRTLKALAKALRVSLTALVR
jgi:transcriptional regulator with XRE-family HTH domain